MLDLFLFVGLPYLSIFVLVAGSIYRYRTNPFSYSALSSQFLESRILLWGSVPWHFGIGILFLGHLAVFFFPHWWQARAANPLFLLAVESAGIMASLLAVIGLFLMILRRVKSARLRVVTTKMDFVILSLFLFQVVLGLLVATRHQWGAVWSTETTTPYLWSLVTFRPDIAFVDTMPFVLRCHLVGAWILFLLIPFSRLIHLFSIPVRFFFRPPQKVVWNNSRHSGKGSL